MRNFVLIALFVGVLFVTPTKGNQVLYGPPVVVTATVTSTKIMNANSLRKYLIIVNRGTSITAVVKFGSVQSGTEGVPIPPGGSYEPTFAPGNSVYAVTGSSTTALTLIEGN